MVALGNIWVGLSLGMLISCCLSAQRLLWVPNANAVSGEIWALRQLVTEMGQKLKIIFISQYHIFTLFHFHNFHQFRQDSYHGVL